MLFGLTSSIILQALMPGVQAQLDFTPPPAQVRCYGYPMPMGPVPSSDPPAARAGEQGSVQRMTESGAIMPRGNTDADHD